MNYGADKQQTDTGNDNTRRPKVASGKSEKVKLASSEKWTPLKEIYHIITRLMLNSVRPRLVLAILSAVFKYTSWLLYYM